MSTTQEELDLTLFGAISTNKVELVKELICKGANLNKIQKWNFNREEFRGHSLRLALVGFPYVKEEIITALLEAGANPNKKEYNYSYSLLELAIHLYKGSDENDKAYETYDPSDYTVNKRQYRFLLSALLEHGADPNNFYNGKSAAEEMLQDARSHCIYSNELKFYTEMLFLVLLHGSYMPEHPSFYLNNHSLGSAYMVFEEIQCWPLLMLLYCLTYKNIYIYLFGLREDAFNKVRDERKLVFRAPS